MNRKRISYISIFISVLIGLVFSVLVYFFVNNYQSRLLRNQFEEEIQILNQSLRRRISNRLEALNSIEDLFAVDANVTNKDFQSFVRRLREDHGELQSLLWISLQNQGTITDPDQAEDLAMKLEYFSGERDRFQKLLKLALNREDVQVIIRKALNGQEQILLPLYELENDRLLIDQTLILNPVFVTRPGGHRVLKGFTAGVLLMDRVILETMAQIPKRRLSQFQMILSEPWKRDRRKLRLFYDPSSGELHSQEIKLNNFSLENNLTSRKQLTIGNKNWGLLYASTPEFFEINRSWLPLILLVIGLTLSGLLGLYLYRVRTLHEKIRILAERDSLTDLYNRRQWMDHLKQELKEAKRYSHPLSVFMIDLDHFKQINDEFGHQCGDRILEKCGEILRSQARESDICGRYGGEKLCVLLPETNLREARKLAERLRKAIHEGNYQTQAGEPDVSCSIGVAQYEAEEDSKSLLKKADSALYDAKENGRNRVEVFESQSV